MSDDLEPLNAAALCRVYAAAGMSVVWTPEQLRRFATLLEANDKAHETVLAGARKLRAEARFWFFATLIYGSCVMGALLYVG